MNSRNKKLLIFVVILINLLGIYSFYYMFFGKEILFDLNKKAKLNPSNIIKVETNQGTWNWNDTIYDFYNNYKVVLGDKKNIEEFREIIEKSSAKYVDNRILYWVDIYINEVDLNAEIHLMETIENEIYFEYENHTYDGEKLSNFLNKHKVKIN